MGEYEKYHELQARGQRLQEDYERQLGEMEESREKALQELTEHYERKLHDKGIQLERVHTIHMHVQYRVHVYDVYHCIHVSVTVG